MPRARKPAAVGPDTANRTDLQGPQPVTAATGQPYGEAGAQMAAQRAVPIAAPTLPTAPGGGGTPPPPPPPPVPGQVVTGGMGGPTQRPNEPVTAGLPSGPGPGPEVMNTMGQSQNTLSALLAQMAATPHATPEVQQLAAYVNSGRR